MAHFGTDPNREIDPQSFYRDTRPVVDRWLSSLMEPMPFSCFMTINIFLMVFYPIIILVILPLNIIFVMGYGQASKKKTLPLKIPKHLAKTRKGILDRNEYVDPISRVPQPPEGILFVGNQRSGIFSGKNEELWLSNSDSRMHLFCAGTTGAGKTESLLSLVFNALCWSSGFIYIDGKADNSLAHKVYAMARRCGREDDLLILNFMQGGVDPFEKKKSPHRDSNTLNPMARGSGDYIANLITSMLPEVSGDSAQWQQKAVGMINALIKVLAFLRHKGEILIDPGTIRDYIPLDKIIELAQRTDLPDSIHAPLKSYLDNLSGFNWAVWNKERRYEPEADKQHGYLSSQFTKLLGTLNDTYGAIFKHQIAEVDMMDVVLNNRILVVLIPSLEKSKIESEGLGKLIVSTLRLMMAITIGDKIEGAYRDVVESRVTNAPSPYQVVLDEAGYYFTEGTAKMFAQARSLGFQLVLSGQDKQAMAKGSNKEEVESCIANSKVKVCMALEDPADTYDVFAKAAGEAVVVQTSGFAANYQDKMNASLEKRTRLTVQELRAQDAGQGTMLFKDKLLRFNSLYVFGKLKINKTNKMFINKFLKVMPTRISEMKDCLEKIPSKHFDLEKAVALFCAGRAPDYGIQEEGLPLVARCIQQATEETAGVDVSKNFQDIYKGVLLYERVKYLLAGHEYPGFTTPLSALDSTDDETICGDAIYEKDEEFPFAGSPEAAGIRIVSERPRSSVEEPEGHAPQKEEDRAYTEENEEYYTGEFDDDEDDLEPYSAEEAYDSYVKHSFHFQKDVVQPGLEKIEESMGSENPAASVAALVDAVGNALLYRHAQVLPPEQLKTVAEIEKLFCALAEELRQVAKPEKVS